jgi:hypothetical protein
LEASPWRAWPNSWKRVSASSQEISTGSPGRPFMKLELFETITVSSPSNRSWLR